MDLNGLLRRAVELGASDIHLKIGQPPILRRDGALAAMEDAPALDENVLTAILNKVSQHAPDKLSHFHSAGDLDIAYQDEDLPRFRVNAYRQRGAISFAFRVGPWPDSIMNSTQGVDPSRANRPSAGARVS